MNLFLLLTLQVWLGWGFARKHLARNVFLCVWHMQFVSFVVALMVMICQRKEECVIVCLSVCQSEMSSQINTQQNTPGRSYKNQTITIRATKMTDIDIYAELIISATSSLRSYIIASRKRCRIIHIITYCSRMLICDKHKFVGFRRHRAHKLTHTQSCASFNFAYSTICGGMRMPHNQKTTKPPITFFVCCGLASAGRSGLRFRAPHFTQVATVFPPPVMQTRTPWQLLGQLHVCIIE